MTEKEESLQTLMEKLQAEDEKLRRKLEPIHNRLVEIRDEMEEINEQFQQEKLSQFDEAKIVSWEYLLEHDPLESKVKQDALEERIAPFDMKVDGYYPKTNQYAIELILYRETPDEQLERIAGFMKYLTQILLPVFDNCIEFTLFEYTLSRDGIYAILFDTEADLWKITRQTYGQLTTLFESKHIVGVLDYARMEYYYKIEYPKTTVGQGS